MGVLAASPEQFAGQVALLLLGAALVGMLARRVGMPYAVALVIGGLLVEETHLITVPTLPGLVLFGFLPPLLFDAAFRLDTREARLLLRPILLLALPGTLFTALVVGGVVAVVLRLPLAVGLLFGSLVAATDPVAVVLAWSGLRGALTITLALALPPETPHRDLVVAMSFGVVLFTLLVQGMTLPLLLRRLGMVQPRRG